MREMRGILCSALFAALALLCVPSTSRAGTYLVCYLPPEPRQRLIRFCPGASDAEAGQPCECLLQDDTLSGTMTRITISDMTAASAVRTMCIPPTQARASVTLCPTFQSDGKTGCTCDGGGGRGEQYTVTLMPRIPLRTNQTAAADLFTRLKECCITK